MLILKCETDHPDPAKFRAASTDITVITGFNTDIEFEGTTYHVQTEDKGLARPVVMSLIYNRGTILASKRTPYDDLIVDDEVDLNVLAERLNKQHRVICAAVKGGRLEDLIRMSQASAAAKAVAETAVGEAAVAGVTSRSFELDVPPIPMPIPDGEPAAVLKPIDLDLNAYAVIEEEILLPDEAVEVLSEMIGKERPANNKLTIELLGDSRFRGGEHKSVSFMVCRGTESKVIADAQVMVKILGSSFRPMIFHARTDANGIAKVNLQFPTFSEGRAALLVRASSDGEEVEFRRLVAHG